MASGHFAWALSSCHILSFFLIMPPTYLDCCPCHSLSMFSAQPAALTFNSGLSQLSMSDNWFHRFIFSIVLTGKIHRFYKTGTEYPSSCFCTAPRGVWQHHKFRVTQASSIHLPPPFCRRRPSILFFSPAASFVFCHDTFPQLSEWERALRHACARSTKLHIFLLKHETLEH